MIQHFAFSVFALCFCTVSFASERDSLVAALSTAKEDTNLVAQYYSTGWQFENDLPDSAMYFYNNGLALSQKLNFKKGEIRYYFNATAVYNIKSDYKTSLKLNKESVEMATEYGDKRLIAAALGNVGSTYSIMGRYDSAVFYFLQASKCMEQLRDSSGMAVLYTNMCGTYNSLRQYEKALEYGKKAIAFFESGIKSFDYVGSMNNIGVSNSRLGNHEKAIEYFKRAYIEAKKTNNTIGVCVNLGNLSQEYLNSRQYEKLKATAKELLQTAKEVDLPDQLSNAYHVNAISYLYEKSYDAALECESKAINLAQKDSQDDQLRRSYNTLSNIWVALGDIEKGDSISGLSTFYFDKLLNEKTIENTSVYEAKYETEKERNKNLLQEHELKQKKIWLGVLVGVLAFIISISALFYYLQRQRQRRIETENILKEEKIQSLEREKKLEASQALLQGEEQERSRLARDLHDGLGGTLSSVKYSFNNMRETIVLSAQQADAFTNSVNKLDDSIADLRRIAQNLMPENLHRFGLDASLRDLCSSVSADGKIKAIYESFGMAQYKTSSSVDLALYRVAQEILHNTIKHAQASQIILQLTCDNSKLLFATEDNGKGFDTSILNTEKGSGFKSMQNRVQLLNGQFHLDSSSQGTSITIEIPL